MSVGVGVGERVVAGEGAANIHLLTVAHDGPQRGGRLLGPVGAVVPAAGDVDGAVCRGRRRVGRRLLGEGRVVETGSGTGKVEAAGAARQDVGRGGKDLGVVELGG